MADTLDKPRRCRQARTLCCCQSTPASTTDPECASAVRQLLQQCSTPLLVLGRSLGDHWPPDLPFNGFAIGGTCTRMSQRSYDVSACPLSPCSDQPAGASRSSTMIQWSPRVTALTTTPLRHCSLCRCRCPCHCLCLSPFPHQMPCHPAFPQTNPVGSSSPSLSVLILPHT